MVSTSFGLKLFLPIVCLMAIQAANAQNSNQSITAGGDDISSWARLQVSSYVMASMPYGTYRVNIYEHQNNLMPGFNGTKRYFYAPIVLLDHVSAYSVYNNVTKEPELRFRVEMWNEQVEADVIKYISLLSGGKVINKHQVEIVPFDKVILSTSSSSADYRLTKDWTPYQFHQWLWFEIICFSMRECDELAVVMRSTPEQFSHLKMFFSLSAQKTQRRETVIRIENVMAGEMAASLDQRYTNPEKPDALLTAADEKRLLTESSTNVLIDSFDDSDVVSAATEAQIYNLLKDMLVSSRTTIKEQSDQMWESVFWNDDNYRPDKTTKTWTDLYKSQSSEVQTKMAEAFKDTNKFDSELSSGGKRIKFSTKVGFDFSREGNSSEEFLEKLWQESKDSVGWEGEKFTPKSMSLARVNVNTLRNTQTLKETSARVSYLTAVLSVALNFRPYTDKPSKDQLFTLQSQINEMNVTMNAMNVTMQAQIKTITPPKPVEGPRPTSCTNYKTMGHTQNGFYLVQSGTSQRVRTTYCDFSKAAGTGGYETAIGYLDVKTSLAGVSFYVQRQSPYSSRGTIPYQVTRLNVGSAMNAATGVFTAPVNGRYHFSFTARSSGVNNYVHLRVNGAFVAVSNAQTVNDNMPIVATLQLTKGDRVDVYLDAGSIYDNNIDYHTQFSGFLLEEDLVL